VLQRRRLAVCEVQNAFGTLVRTVQSILENNIKMYKMATKLVLCLLSELQRESHVSRVMSAPARTFQRGLDL
jgi:hypothetical protein